MRYMRSNLSHIVKYVIAPYMLPYVIPASKTQSTPTVLCNLL